MTTLHVPITKVQQKWTLSTCLIYSSFSQLFVQEGVARVIPDNLLFHLGILEPIQLSDTERIYTTWTPLSHLKKKSQKFFNIIVHLKISSNLKKNILLQLKSRSKQGPHFAFGWYVSFMFVLDYMFLFLIYNSSSFSLFLPCHLLANKTGYLVAYPTFWRRHLIRFSSPCGVRSRCWLKFLLLFCYWEEARIHHM